MGWLLKILFAAAVATAFDYLIQYLAGIGWFGFVIGNAAWVKPIWRYLRWAFKAIAFVIVLRMETRNPPNEG